MQGQVAVAIKSDLSCRISGKLRNLEEPGASEDAVAEG